MLRLQCNDTAFRLAIEKRSSPRQAVFQGDPAGRGVIVSSYTKGLLHTGVAYIGVEYRTCLYKFVVYDLLRNTHGQSGLECYDNPLFAIIWMESTAVTYRRWLQHFQSNKCMCGPAPPQAQNPHKFDGRCTCDDMDSTWQCPTG